MVPEFAQARVQSAEQRICSGLDDSLLFDGYFAVLDTRQAAKQRYPASGENPSRKSYRGFWGAAWAERYLDISFLRIEIASLRIGRHSIAVDGHRRHHNIVRPYFDGCRNIAGAIYRLGQFCYGSKLFDLAA